MTGKLEHTILIVDDEAIIGRAIGHVVKGVGAQYVYVDSTGMAMDKIKNTEIPFALIISDQNMPGMKGAEFLEKAKVLSPDSVRFLITGYSDIDAIVDAVNKGSIHRYISKPWDNEEFAEAIKAGLERYDLGMENQRLLALAKEQNSKLYKLNNDLKKRTAVYKDKIRKKEKQIEQFRRLLERGFKTRNFIDEVEVFLIKKSMLDQSSLGQIHETLVDELFEQFQNIAARRGFKMPDSARGELNAG